MSCLLDETSKQLIIETGVPIRRNQSGLHGMITNVDAMEHDDRKGFPSRYAQEKSKPMLLLTNR